MIQERILELTEYGLVTGLIEPQDKRFTINRLLELFHIDELEDEVTAAYEKRTAMTQESAEEALPQILAEMLDYAAEQMLIPDRARWFAVSMIFMRRSLRRRRRIIFTSCPETRTISADTA